MKNSESTPDESVEQHSHQSSGPQLESCPNCDVVGLPERIAAHDCRPSLTHPDEHADTTPSNHTIQGPALKLDTTIVRQREADHTTGSLEITRAATTGPTLTLGLINNTESTTVELSPQQAVRVADTLQATATDILTSELPDDAPKTTPNTNSTREDAESTPSTEPTLEVFETDD